jgi:ATP-binding cassette, subfamily B, multidrug efflux pump
MKQLLRLRELLRPYWKQTLFTTLLLLVLTGIEMVFPTIIQWVVDFGLVPGKLRLVLAAAGIIIGLGLLKSVLGYYNRFTAEKIANHVAFDLRNRLYDHLQNMPFSYHDHMQSGQLISRVIEDVRSLQGFTGHGIMELARVILLTVAVSVVLISTHAKLALIALLPLIPLILITSDFGRKIGDLFLMVDNTLGELSSHLQENVTGVQVVRAFSREQFEIQKFNQTNRKLYNSQLTVLASWSRIMPTTNLLITLSTILILWFGGQMVLNEQLTIGQLVAVNSYVLLLMMPAQQLGWLVNAGGEASAGIQRIFEILDHTPEIHSPVNALTPGTLSGKVEFKQVSFRYHGDRTNALEDVNLTVHPNQVVALIGTTGSGKTTLVNLIPRFYDVTDGEVLVDGMDVRNLDLTQLRRQIGIVLQTSLLFSTSIRENIAYGRPDATEDEVIAAAQAAQAHEFILKLPQGYETIIGERGITLSGGQRQRVAIARALLLNPRILILDDSTSSVDTETEHLLQTALSHLMEGRTTFIIAQRLSSVRRADLILVMDEGRVLEQGTHKDLLTNSGLYREIYELQLQDQERFHDDLEQTHDDLPEPSHQEEMGN